MDWFEKKSDAQKAEYCQGHPNSKICRLYLGKKKTVVIEDTPAQRLTKASQTPGYYDTEGEHEWAKKSTVQNLGEDIKGSARHKKNLVRDWGDIQQMSSNKDFDLKELMKFANTPVENIPEGHALAYWVIKDIMSRFPQDCNFNPEQKQKWIELYQIFYQKGVEIADANTNPVVVAKLFTDYLTANKPDRNPGDNNLTYHLRDFCGSASKDTLRAKNGTIAKLCDVAFGVKSPTDTSRLVLLEDKIGSMGGDIKMRMVLSGAPLKSTLTGIKADVDTFCESDVYANIVLMREGAGEFKNYEDSSSYLMDQIKFKGVQFGNSLSDKEKITHVMQTAQAFKDMSETMGISAANISMGGKLAIGFGSRGVTGSMAHYNTAYKFMNINRHNGYGSLAHEWSHGLGFNIGEKIIALKKPDTNKKFCFSQFRPDYLEGTPYFDISLKFKAMKEKVNKRVKIHPDWKGLGAKSQNWILGSEEMFARAFESYAHRKTTEKGITNTYLVNSIDHFAWPTKEELDEYVPLFDELLKMDVF